MGLPVVIGTGTALKVMANPEIRQAVASAAAYSSSVAKEFGSTSMASISKMTPTFDVKNPFSVSNASKTTEMITNRVTGASGKVTISEVNSKRVMMVEDS